MSIYFDLKTINELTGSNSFRQPKELTLDDLSQYDGRGGKPAYVAIEGVVYDVSNESNWSGGTHHGLNAGKDLTDQFNSCHGMMQILNNAPKVGILVDDNNMRDMNFDINENMMRQVKQNTSNFRPDDWIRYIEPIVSYSLNDTNQGTGLQGAGARRSYQKAILLGVLVGLGKTPQEAITQVQQWQNTGATTLLGGPSTGGTTSGGTGTGGTTGGGTGTGGTTGGGMGTGGTTGGGMGTGGTTSGGMGTGGTTGGGMGTGGTTSGGMGTGGTTGGGMGTGGTTGGGMGTGGTTGGGMGTGGTTGGGMGTGGTTGGGAGTGGTTRGESIVRNRLFFD
ncbi:cytochrome b5 domain-containing protein [Clostridium beijerinckii]|uniref:Cytochrome b5 n=1 Tax=Clostridium beijerinckii TaxID=1520 RepID=A0AAW3WEI5_CLOBE|nr:cytochrome b5 domain-containing protein [Clostridium beijerinckii]MBC2459842.1 cytochrome b5 [Clostridium beijerinckii]MBC2477345.1 cytochrome b5 [Clostridium beijerinckii]NOV60015.1 putative heme/steroid binding protein [Clostridium beijerinckii]NOV71204.1 putative heme/steroid binding protein [Clostridium beijerinckii]NOW34128.1 putative heme/steroid binding protein [Clostridium beijerinckii]